MIKPVLPCTAGSGGQCDSAGIHGEHLIDFGGLEFPSGSNQNHQRVFSYDKENICGLLKWIVCCVSVG